MAINVSLAQLTTLNNTSILGQINSNNAIIQTALTDAVSRSGQLPNNMQSPLDMNSNQIFNLPPPATGNSPARLNDVTSTIIPVSFPTLIGDVTGSVNISTGNTTTTVQNVSTAGSIKASAMPALTGDVTTSAGGVSTTIVSNAVTNAKLATIPAHAYKGNNTGSTATAADITSTQLTADLNQFTTSLQGVVPGSGGGTTNFLRADGTWNTPAGGSFSAPNIQIFTTATTATYTTPTFNSALPLYIHVMMVGAGGGAGGTGAGGGAGTAGTASSFGTALFVANGGANGVNSPTAGTFPSGGTATGGQINVQGQNGSPNSVNGNAAGLIGGSSFYGGGGAAQTNNSAATTGDAAKTNSGSGGAVGGITAAVISASSGASGGYCEGWITSSIAASYSYTVGAKGTGGAAGTSGSIGGAGADGRITVVAYWQ